MYTIPDLLNAFPEFSNANQYPPDRITFWLGVSQNMVNQRLWGLMYSQGVFLLTAHYLTLDAINRNQLKDGALPGTVDGLDTGQKSDVESYTLSVSDLTLKDGGMFNKTSYGIQYLQLAKWRGSVPLTALSSGRHCGY